jgi:hypothetical protein
VPYVTRSARLSREKHSHQEIPTRWRSGKRSPVDLPPSSTLPFATNGCLPVTGCPVPMLGRGIMSVGAAPQGGNNPRVAGARAGGARPGRSGRAPASQRTASLDNRLKACASPTERRQARRDDEWRGFGPCVRWCLPGRVVTRAPTGSGRTVEAAGGSPLPRVAGPAPGPGRAAPLTRRHNLVRQEIAERIPSGQHRAAMPRFPAYAMS